MKTLRGVVASQGIAIAPAKVFIKEKLEIQEEHISSEKIVQEQDRLKQAFDAYLQTLNSREAQSETEKEVTAAHIELLSDPYFIETAQQKIHTEKMAAEWALRTTVDEMSAMIEMLDDPYMRERAADYRDIGQNLLYNLKGMKPATLENLKEDCIIVSDELTPSDTSLMDKEHVMGFANDLGGKTSHTSIIAQTLGIPALVGMKEVTSQVKDGDLLILDAHEGVVYINPDEETLNTYAAQRDAIEREKKRLEEFKDAPAITTDEHLVEVSCNMGNLQDLDLGLSHGADGCGLFRTEFLYMDNSHFPTEEEQYEVYKKAAEALEGKPLLIRTLDIGGDKSLSYYQFPKEENPFLGWRALRICFDKPEVFNAQLRAILRASAHGNVKILLPMIISVDELQQVKARVEALKAQLKEEKIAYDENIDVGVMIETPASVFMAEELAKYCDYFSIGTNDLTQYTLAVDRGNERITHLYNSFNPAVLRAIAKVIEAAHHQKIWCGMCGGFAGETEATYLLLGLGLDEFSCPASKIAKVKDIVRQAKFSEAQAFAQKVLQCETIEQAENLIAQNPLK